MKIPKIKTVVAWATIRETVEKTVRVVIPADRAGDVKDCLNEMCEAGEINILTDEDDGTGYLTDTTKREIMRTRTSADFRPICVHCAECDKEDGQVFCTAYEEWKDMDDCNEFCADHDESGTEDDK